MELPEHSPSASHQPAAVQLCRKSATRIQHCELRLLDENTKVDYDLWAEVVGDQRWSCEGLLPLFKRVRHYHDPNADSERSTIFRARLTRVQGVRIHFAKL
jgi:hypothetical protein